MLYRRIIVYEDCEDTGSPHAAPQEGHELRSCAVIVRAERSAANAAADAVFCRPHDRACIVSVGCHIAERGAAADRRTAVRTIEESHRLRTSAGYVGTEEAVARADGDAAFNSPGDCLGIVAVCGNVGEVTRPRSTRRTGGAPEEGDELCAGAGQVGSEEFAADATAMSVS